MNTAASFINTSTGTITNYNWDFGDGNTSSQTNATNSYTSAGIFPVTLTASNTAGCQNFLTKNFSVYSEPVPDFVIEAPPYSCANYPAQFDNNTPPLLDSNITTWAWSFGDAANGTSNQKNPSYTYSTASTYNVSLKATSNFGCNATKQHSITIYPSPQAGFTNTPACVNQNTQFRDASTGSVTSYQWLIQGTTLTGANPPPYVFKSSGTFPVSLTVTSTNGCKNQVVKNISVPIPPVMDFIYQLPCAGKPTTFQELNPGGTDPSIAWNWNFGSGSGVGSPVDYSFTAPGIYLVTLSATRNSGCIYSTSKNVAIFSGPVAKFTPSTQGGAPPLSVTFSNESIADSYFWQFGSGNSTSTEVSPVYTFSDLGEYKVLLTASNIHGCTDTASTKIYVVIPTVDLAMKNFSLVEDPSSNSSKPVVTISNLGNIPLTNPEVQIDLGGNALLKEKIMATVLPGKTVQQILSLEIVPQALGYICAEVASAGDIDVYNDRQCLSMTNDDVLFHPYPNPASGKINFDWISSESEKVTVTIFKSTGQVTFKQDFQMVQSGINQLTIDISGLSSGLYLIQFSGAKATKSFSVSVIN
jgi:PKD repeat protein